MEQLEGLLLALAKGEIAIGDLAGLTLQDKVKILQLGIAQLKGGRHDDALRTLEALVALDHQNPLFREYLGLAYEKVGRLDDALVQYDAHLDGLARIDDAGARLLEGHMLRARVQLMRGAPELAKADVDRAKHYDDGADPALTQELSMLERAAGGAR